MDDVPLPPPLPREFRGVWVASVANIDWPSAPGLPPETQRAEATAILDRAAALNLNVIILQVRPAADALYPSPLEPWSYYLSGEQGRPPAPAYDPLAFWIAEAHARGFELHAWLNPFRVRPAGSSYEPHDSSIARTHPHVVKEHGEPGKTQLWMDPAEPAARARALAVVRDLLGRYDLDGIHIDDYFYPYPVAGHEFPDDASYAGYRARGGRLSRGDFRRAHVNRLVRDLYAAIKRERPHVKFGISPFGIWRPGHPAGIEGFDQYAGLYADARLWLREGWCDYWAPQLYWPIARAPQSFPVLLAWWARQNRQGRTLAPGLFTSRVFPTEQDWPAEEIVGQVLTARAIAGAGEGGGGAIHFSMKALSANVKRIGDELSQRVYAGRALPPAITWIDARPPRVPRVSALRGAGVIEVSRRPALPAPRRWTIQVLRGGRWTLQQIVDGGTMAVTVADDPGAPVRAIAVRALDGAGNASAPAVLVVGSGRQFGPRMEPARNPGV